MTQLLRDEKLVKDKEDCGNIYSSPDERLKKQVQQIRIMDELKEKKELWSAKNRSSIMNRNNKVVSMSNFSVNN